MKSPFISLVIPVMNEESSLRHLYNTLKKILQKYKYEIIFVNDGSDDDSALIIEKLHRKDIQVKMISLSRNFGHQMAITCGLDYASGDVAIIMDADLQDPPALITRMMGKWREGYDVVYGIRRLRRGENGFKLITARLFYLIINKLSRTKIPQSVGDFRLISKNVITILKHTREYQRYLRGIISWVGFKQIGIEYSRDKRFAGKSKYNSWAMVTLGMDALLSFSFFPLRIASLVGSLSAIGAFIYILYALFITALGLTVKGWSSTVVLILFLGSVQLISLGIIGEYLGRIYEEIKHRPMYIINSMVGFPKQPDNIQNRSRQ